MASSANVLRVGGETFNRSLFGRPSSRAYRIAVAEIIRDVQGRFKLSDERLGELIGCSKQTVINARGDFPENDLSAVTLLNIAYAFGEEAIEPVRALYLCKPAEQPTILSEIDRARQALNAAEKLISEREL